MKILTIVTSVLFVFGTSQMAQAGSWQGHNGYKQGYKRGYKHGHNNWRATRQGHKPRHYSHKPKHYGNKPKHYGNKPKHYGNKPKYYGHNRHDGYLWGGLFIGALLGHALTRNSYQSDPSYTTYSTIPTYEESATLQTTPLDEEIYRERLILGADGSCTLVTRDSDGKESWLELAPSEC